MRAQNVPDDRREEVLQAFHIRALAIREVMVPRDEIIALSSINAPEESLQIAAEHTLSRFPLVDGTLDEPVGTIYVPLLLRNWDRIRAGEATLEELAAPAITMPAECTVSDLIDHLQEQDQKLALIGDGGRIVGLKTITDAFEVIAGEVQDPLDRVHRHLPTQPTV